MTSAVATRDAVSPPAVAAVAGCVSVLAGLSYAKPLAGIVCFSGWAALRSEYPGIINAANAGTKVLMCHGKSDPTVRGVAVGALHCDGGYLPRGVTSFVR